jgi:Phage Tail Collar Domain
MPRFVGQISLFPYNFQPQGWIFFNGQAFPISDALPNLGVAAPAKFNYYIGVQGTLPPPSQDGLSSLRA